MQKSAQRVRPISWWWALLAVALVASAVAVSMVVMLAQTEGLHGAQRATARIDAIKTALTIGAGTGGAAALLLALRRQWLSEHTHVRQEAADTIAEFDARERRITELYTAAAGQLASDSAPVRLAGLYALERLAQDHVDHRQTIVNVICAYLRMPFSPTRPHAEDAAESWEQERVVRVTAQGILTGHLFVGGGRGDDPTWPLNPSPQEPRFWAGMELDLSGATLLDFEFTGRRVEMATFDEARFFGTANSAHAEFTGHVSFDKARFEQGHGHFLSAWFGLRVTFIGTDFGSEQAVFKGATFTGMVFFREAVLPGGVCFEAARGLADFNRSWGSVRQWPDGWTERPLGADERMPLLAPRFSRWPESNLPPGSSTWALIVPDSAGRPAD
ncbi:pentapeptide repeat-containing protein [Streptomyces sp. NPDC058625]|uniref:pentapeptide repeat-containing protein n=1 Tax=Streptomyces sp. NPDC058625 TaxID=3346564 RepID=UPI003657881C